MDSEVYAGTCLWMVMCTVRIHATFRNKVDISDALVTTYKHT